MQPGSVCAVVGGCILYVFIYRDTAYQASSARKLVESDEFKKTSRTHLHLKMICFFCSSAVFNLAFPLALCVFFNTQYVSALKKKNSHNQESINRHYAVRIKSRGSLTFSLEYQFISKLFSALHLLQCFVTVHCQFQTTPMI